MTNINYNLENLKTRIAAVPMDVIKLELLKDELEVFKEKKLQQGAQALLDTIAVIKRRIEELENDLAISSRQD